MTEKAEAKKKGGRENRERERFLLCFRVEVWILLPLLASSTINTSISSSLRFLQMNRFDIVQIYHQYCGNNFLLFPYRFKFQILLFSLDSCLMSLLFMICYCQFSPNIAFVKPFKSFNVFCPFIICCNTFLFLGFLVFFMQIYVFVFLRMHVNLEDVILL